jgi:hypothetical protein
MSALFNQTNINEIQTFSGGGFVPGGETLNVSTINTSTINGSLYFPFQNLWETQSKTLTGSPLRADNISTVAVRYASGDLGTSIALPKGIYQIQTLAYIGNNGGANNTVNSDLLPSMKFSTGMMTVYGESIRNLSTAINNAIVPFVGILDCPVDNAPIQFFAQTGGSVDQSILQGIPGTNPGNLTFTYAKLDSVT